MPGITVAEWVLEGGTFFKGLIFLDCFEHFNNIFLFFKMSGIFIKGKAFLLSGFRISQFSWYNN